eukprot:CAMPEP_0197194692 /NCGR_PEP_ID=MMETSP1423-20130617/29702_1 /TAXON_ID=476441 /ORGANISM="Pseudo-nitzschia heimii, Strain UNC1101" /LENGTH=972 /DNA_ID=CAMNT_0042648151 /DNA_START=239 /DNA_END=3154 /DNA_ORIENTATION=+
MEYLQDETREIDGKKTGDNCNPKMSDWNMYSSSYFSILSHVPKTVGTDTNSNESASKMRMRTGAENLAIAASHKDSVARRKDERLKQFFSVAYFKATPLDEFRRECKNCLKFNLVESTRMANPQMNAVSSHHKTSEMNGEFNEYIRYDHLEIRRRLMYDIDWKSLCEHHDKYGYKQRRPNLTNSALNEIISAVTNPTLIPTCCQKKCLVDVFLNALLVSPSVSISIQRRQRMSREKHASDVIATNMTSRWSPSQQLLLKEIRRLLSSELMLLDSPTTNYVRDFFSLPPFSPGKRVTEMKREVEVSNTLNSTSILTLSANKVNRLLSAIYWLLDSSVSLPAFSCWERDLVFAGLLLLQRVDGWSIQLELELRQQYLSAVYTFPPYDCPLSYEDTSGSKKAPRKRLPRRINKIVKSETLSTLHDEPLYLKDKTIQKFHNSSEKTPWRHSSWHDQKQVSLKDILAIKQNRKQSNDNAGILKVRRRAKMIRGEIATLQRTGVPQANKIPHDWSIVRSRAYKKFVAFTVERRRRQQHLRISPPNGIRVSIGMKSIPTVQNSYRTLLRWMVNDVSVYLEAPSRRVCLALVAHSLGGPKNPFYFQYVACLLWQGYEISWRNRNMNSSQWLRVYSEWIGECAIFDKLIVAWDAMQPLIHHITARLSSHKNEQCNSTIVDDAFSNLQKKGNGIKDSPIDKNEDNKDLEPSLLACLAYILHRRSYMFMIFGGNEEDNENSCIDSDSRSRIENEFKSFVNILAVYCEESPEAWLCLFSNSTRDLVASTLQRLGVLGFFDSTKIRKTKNIYDTYTDRYDIPAQYVATSQWPFSDEFSLREAIGRIDRAVINIEDGSDAIKSLLTRFSALYPKVQRMTKKRKSKKSFVSVSITSYLHDSGILCLIFSFCSAKRLAKIPQVCKEWKVVFDTVSNNFWEKAYIANFGKYRWPYLAVEHKDHTVSIAKVAVDLNYTDRKDAHTSAINW